MPGTFKTGGVPQFPGSPFLQQPRPAANITPVFTGLFKFYSISDSTPTGYCRLQHPLLYQEPHQNKPMHLQMPAVSWITAATSPEAPQDAQRAPKYPVSEPFPYLCPGPNNSPLGYSAKTIRYGQEKRQLLQREGRRTTDLRDSWTDFSPLGYWMLLIQGASGGRNELNSFKCSHFTSHSCTEIPRAFTSNIS